MRDKFIFQSVRLEYDLRVSLVDGISKYRKEIINFK